MKYLVILAFAAILGSLASALFFMMREGKTNDQGHDKNASSANDANRQKSDRMLRALALRVGFSILLFACILLAWKFGYIHPTGIRPGQ